MTTPRQRAARRLVTTLNRDRYPSHQVLDRLEASVALQALEARMANVREAFGVTDEELDLDLGPLGHLR